MTYPPHGADGAAPPWWPPSEAGWSALLDGLAAGDLDEPTRAAVLRRLEETPDGWRRCAIAFLEAQAFRDHFRATALQAAPGPSAALPAAVVLPAPPIEREVAPLPAERPRRMVAAASRGRETGLGLAACLASAVMGALGTAVMVWTMGPSRTRGGDAIVGVERPDGPSRAGPSGFGGSGVALTDRGARPTDDRPRGVAATDPAGGDPRRAGGRAAPETAPGAGPATVQTLVTFPDGLTGTVVGTALVPATVQTLVTFPDGQRRHVTVPVGPGPSVLVDPAAIAKLRRTWQDAGLVVEDTEHFQPVTLPDGRTGVVPVGGIRAYPSAPSFR